MNPQSFINSLNILLAPLVILLLIKLDYIQIRATNQIQRKIFLTIIELTVISILCEIIYSFVAGSVGTLAYHITYFAYFAYFIFQIASYHLVNLFVDYYVHKSRTRAKKFILLFTLICAAHIILLLINIRYDFYFTITPENYFKPGALYVLNTLFSFLAPLITLANLLSCHKTLQKNQVHQMIFFIVFSSAGLVLNLMMPGANLMCPFFCSFLLFSYFFIIRKDSYVDILTGIDNRRSCQEYFKTMRKQQTYSFIMIDLDHFKSINDKFGHAQGDRALKDVAQLIRSCLRRTDFFARYGGDEFLIVTPMVDDVEALITRLNTKLSEFHEKNVRPYMIEMSIGYDCYWPDCGFTPEEFITQVDALMYQDKAHRRAVDFSKNMEDRKSIAPIERLERLEDLEDLEDLEGLEGLEVHA